MNVLKEKKTKTLYLSNDGDERAFLHSHADALELRDPLVLPAEVGVLHEHGVLEVVVVGHVSRI